MINFNEMRNDRDFILNNITYNEMLEVMKIELSVALSEYVGVEVQSGKIKIEVRNCFIRSSYGADGDLYPKVKLDVCVERIGNWMLIFNPFEIYLAEYDGSENRYRSNALDSCLINMMTKLFRNSNYLEKREKYFKDAKINKKVNEILIIN